MSGKYCNRKGDVPTEAHYAIVEFSSIHIPGDERSRTHPGHGYPASNEPISRYIAYADREEWVAEVKRRAAQKYSSSDFVAFEVGKSVTFRTEIVIE